MDCAEVGALIRALRLEKGLTQRALAEKIGVGDKAVSKWERGMGCPDVTLLPALAALPDGDAVLLQDAMSDEDYQTFLELLGL